MKALLVILDGASYDLLEKYKDSLPNLTSLMQEGFYGRLESVFPALTPIAIASLLTGRLPKNHGIVYPKLFFKGRKLSDPVSAFSSEGLTAEPVWYYLGKQGRKVLVTSSPQALPDKWKLPNVKLADPFKMKVKKCSDATLLSEGENRVHGKLWLVEKSGSSYRIAYPRGEDYVITEVEVGKWSEPLTFTAKCKEGEMEGVVLLKGLTNGVYVSPAVYFNSQWANDEGLMKDVWEKVVKNAGAFLDADHHSLQKGLITFNEFIETAELAFKFFTAYTTFLLTNYEWDFAIAYLPIIDNLQHLLFGLGEEYEEHIRWAYRKADEFVGTIANFADALFITSDHGIARVSKRVYINKLLMDLGLLKLNERNEIDWSRTKAIYAGGGAIRINLKGREKGGIVSKDEYPKVVRKIVRALEEVGGTEVFAFISSSEQPAGDREGDITFVVKEPYGPSTAIRSDVNVIEDVKPLKVASGEHGYFRKEDFSGILVMRVKSVRGGKRLEKVKIVDVMPTILKLYGIDSVKVDGVAIFDVVSALNRQGQYQH